MIFDLDGTLYQQNDFHTEYLQLLIEGTPWQAHYDALLAYTERMLRGDAPQRIGEFYATQLTPVSDLDELNQITTIKNDADNFADAFYTSEYSYIGDAWSILLFMSRALGIEGNKRTRAFYDIRKSMLARKTLITDAALFDTICALRDSGKHLYLFTNTPAESAEDFVDALGLARLIEHIEYGINKPYGLIDRLPDIVKRAGGDEHIVSIGDHSFNDLSPVKAAGGKTILVSPHEVYDNINWTARIHTLSQLNVLLQQMLTEGQCNHRFTSLAASIQ